MLGCQLSTDAGMERDMPPCHAAQLAFEWSWRYLTLQCHVVTVIFTHTTSLLSHLLKTLKVSASFLVKMVNKYLQVTIELHSLDTICL